MSLFPTYPNFSTSPPKLQREIKEGLGVGFFGCLFFLFVFPVRAHRSIQYLFLPASNLSVCSHRAHSNMSLQIPLYSQRVFVASSRFLKNNNNKPSLTGGENLQSRRPILTLLLKSGASSSCRQLHPRRSAGVDGGLPPAAARGSPKRRPAGHASQTRPQPRAAGQPPAPQGQTQSGEPTNTTRGTVWGCGGGTHGRASFVRRGRAGEAPFPLCCRITGAEAAGLCPVPVPVPSPSRPPVHLSAQPRPPLTDLPSTPRRLRPAGLPRLRRPACPAAPAPARAMPFASRPPLSPAPRAAQRAPARPSAPAALGRAAAQPSLPLHPPFPGFYSFILKRRRI